MATFYSPTDNPEVWQTKPDGYYTHDEWAALHPPPAPSFDEAKEAKFNELNLSFKHRISGALTTSQGYSMQFDPSDAIKMQGAIQLLEASGATEGYLTQANDETIYNIPLATMKAVLIEMMSAYAACHARKQELRAIINAAQTAEELDEIVISWPV